MRLFYLKVERRELLLSIIATILKAKYRRGINHQALHFMTDMKSIDWYNATHRNQDIDSVLFKRFFSIWPIPTLSNTPPKYCGLSLFETSVESH